MRILVTGAAGLIGSAVAARLASGNDVVGLDLIDGQQVSIVGDCSEATRWGGEVGTIDAVVHTAALHAPHVGQRSDEEFRRANVEGTARLIEFALGKGASHFVLTSTTSVYGHALEDASRAVWVNEQLEPRPRDIYDATKLAAEELVTLAGDAMTVTSLRMSRCFPEPADVMAWYRLYRGIDRRDVAEAHALALGRSGAPRTYVISSSTPFRPVDCENLLRNAPAVIEQRCPALIATAALKGWRPPRSIDRVYDASRASRELGFSPRQDIESCLSGDWDPLPSR